MPIHLWRLYISNGLRHTILPHIFRPRAVGVYCGPSSCIPFNSHFLYSVILVILFSSRYLFKTTVPVFPALDIQYQITEIKKKRKKYKPYLLVWRRIYPSWHIRTAVWLALILSGCGPRRSFPGKSESDSQDEIRSTGSTFYCFSPHKVSQCGHGDLLHTWKKINLKKIAK